MHVFNRLRRLADHDVPPVGVLLNAKSIGGEKAMHIPSTLAGVSCLRTKVQPLPEALAKTEAYTRGHQHIVLLHSRYRIAQESVAQSEVPGQPSR